MCGTAQLLQHLFWFLISALPMTGKRVLMQNIKANALWTAIYLVTKSKDALW